MHLVNIILHFVPAPWPPVKNWEKGSTLRGRPTLSIMQKYIRASSTHYLKPSHIHVHTHLQAHTTHRDTALQKYTQARTLIHMQLVTLSPNHIRSSSTSHTHVYVYKHKGTHTNLQLNICTRTPRNRQRHTNVGTCRHRQTCREDI